jgi:hypothetical protein
MIPDPGIYNLRKPNLDASARQVYVRVISSHALLQHQLAFPRTERLRLSPIKPPHFLNKDPLAKNGTDQVDREYSVIELCTENLSDTGSG